MAGGVLLGDSGAPDLPGEPTSRAQLGDRLGHWKRTWPQLLVCPKPAAPSRSPARSRPRTSTHNDGVRTTGRL